MDPLRPLDNSRRLDVRPKANPLKSLKLDYLRSELAQCDANYLLERVLEEMEQNERHKLHIIRLQNKIKQLEIEVQRALSLATDKNNQKSLLVAIQQKNSEKLRRLEQEIGTKVSQGKEWEKKYHDLKKNLDLYTNQITVLQQEFKEHYNKLMESNKAAIQSHIDINTDLTIRNNQLLASLEQAAAEKTILETRVSQQASLIERLQGQNGENLAKAKLYVTDFNQAVEVVDQLVAESAVHKARILTLQKHLEESISEIERLNDLIKEGIKNDNQAYKEIEKLQEKMGRLREENEELHRSTETLRTRNETDKRMHAQSLDTLNALNQELQKKIQEGIVKRQQVERKLLQREEELRQLTSQIEQKNTEIKRLEMQLKQTAENYERELESNNKIAQELERYKKLGSNKNQVLGSFKEKIREDRSREFSLLEFQGKLEKQAETHTTPSGSPLKRILSRSIPMQPDEQITNSPGENLKKIVEEISQKVTELSVYQSGLGQKTMEMSDILRRD